MANLVSRTQDATFRRMGVGNGQVSDQVSDEDMAVRVGDDTHHHHHKKQSSVLLPLLAGAAIGYFASTLPVFSLSEAKPLPTDERVDVDTDTISDVDIFRPEEGESELE